MPFLAAESSLRILNEGLPGVVSVLRPFLLFLMALLGIVLDGNSVSPSLSNAT
jgi:hypothetical protein